MHHGHRTRCGWKYSYQKMTTTGMAIRMPAPSEPVSQTQAPAKGKRRRAGRHPDQPHRTVAMRLPPSMIEGAMYGKQRPATAHGNPASLSHGPHMRAASL